LRPGLLFSDGTPVTAADVVRCLSSAARIGQQAQVRAEGERRIVLHMKRPNARFDLTLSHMECGIHKHAGARLLGSGAYVMTAESTPEFVRLVRNPHYRRPFTIDEGPLRS
jgi:MarR-like DNA-binding transcriptional regulator SgrR of sgrS sRNA